MHYNRCFLTRIFAFVSRRNSVSFAPICRNPHVITFTASEGCVMHSQALLCSQRGAQTFKYFVDATDLCFLSI